MKAVVAFSLLLAGCAGKREAAPDEAARLIASIDPFRIEYRQSIDDENQLRLETLAWLRGAAVTAPRTRAAGDARRLMERWAKVYFVPRWMHEKLRDHRYSTPEVSAVHARLLAHLRRRYFELHDYQRYSQYASESAMHHTPAGYLPGQLKEFQRRLEARGAATDEMGGILAELSRGR